MVNKYYKSVYGLLSKTIMEVLSKEELDLQVIFTFSLYLKLSALKSFCSHTGQNSRFVDQLIELNAEEIKDHNEDKKPADLFENNEDSLCEIFTEVWNGQYSDELQWLTTWESRCKEGLSEPDQPHFVCLTIYKIVDEHLELPKELSQSSLNLIQKLLAKCAN